MNPSVSTSRAWDDQTSATASAGQVISESFAYTAIDAVQNLFAVLVVPASLFWLTPTDMGVVTLAWVITQFAVTLAALGMDFGVVRFFLAWPADEREPRAVGALVVVTCAALLMTCVAAVASLAFMPSATGVIVTAVAAGAGLAVRAIPLAVFRVTSAMRPYAWIVVTGSAIQSVLQIALLVAGRGVIGFLSAITIASWVGAVWAALVLVRGGVRVWRWPDAAIIKLGGWSLAGGLANRSAANVDRLAVGVWSTVDALGVYGTATRWALPLRMISGGTKLAIAPALSRAEHTSTSAATTRSIAGFVTLLALLSVLLLGMSSVLLLTPWRGLIGDFQRLLALLLAAQLIGCLALIGQVLLYYRGLSGKSATLAVVSAATAVAGLLCLVPRYGVTGAAIAQLVSSAATLIVFGCFAGRTHWVALRADGPLAVLAAALVAPWLVGPGVTTFASIAAAAVLSRWAWRDWRSALMRVNVPTTAFISPAKDP